MQTVAFSRHDHSACVASAVAAVAADCAAKGRRLTPVRARVLELLLQRHRAMGAYDILDVLRAEGLGSQPPVVYRALDFLTSHGYAHRIERLNAFVACVCPERDHAPAFLICTGCEAVAEADQEAPLAGAARATGFAIEAAVVEATGLCPNCAAS